MRASRMLRHRSPLVPWNATGDTKAMIRVARVAVHRIGHGETLRPGGRISGGSPWPRGIHASRTIRSTPAATSRREYGWSRDLILPNAKVSDRCLEAISTPSQALAPSNTAQTSQRAPVHSTAWFDDDAVRHRIPDHSRI
jgi:hypothetical protein